MARRVRLPVRMAQRLFQDDLGVMWQAWETIPSAAERRTRGERRRGSGGPPAGGRERRVLADRRRRAEQRIPVSRGYERGWLTFESGAEKRRLVPVPLHWEELSDGALAELCALAASVPRRRGRLIE